MSNRKNIEKEIEKTMQALDGMERMRTDDYFFTRLQARMDREQEASLWRAVWNEPRYALGIAAMSMIIIFNIFSVFQYQSYNEILNREDLNSLSAEYSPDMPLLYELDEVQDGD